MLKSSLVLLLICLGFSAAKADISQLQQFLKQREEVAKVFLPQQLMVGDSGKILVRAPGAKKVTLLGSFENNGCTAYPQLSLRLGEEHHVIAEINMHGTSQVSYPLAWDEEQMLKIINKDYFIEAVVTYEEAGQDIDKRAAVFGSSATFIGYNGIRIVPRPKDRSGLAEMARTMIPGMGTGGGLGTGY